MSNPCIRSSDYAPSDELLVTIPQAVFLGELSFREAVYLICQCIPIGRVSTYGALAKYAGLPNLARQVGSALRTLDEHRSDPSDPNAVPWWRVVKSNGDIALPLDQISAQLQIKLLNEEGVIVTNGRISMRDYAWSSPSS
jgi:methylated-DNA-protein-cysteine methyltransferase related protein